MKNAYKNVKICLANREIQPAILKLKIGYIKIKIKRTNCLQKMCLLSQTVSTTTFMTKK